MQLPVGQSRSINDAGKLNTGDAKENRYKTESRSVHNAKLEFLLIQKKLTRINLNLAYVYSRTSDSDYLFGMGYPLGRGEGQGHCDSAPYSQADLGVFFPGTTIVFCKKCNKNYTETDLHFCKKSTAVLMAAAWFLHAKETSEMTVNKFVNIIESQIVII